MYTGGINQGERNSGLLSDNLSTESRETQRQNQPKVVVKTRKQSQKIVIKSRSKWEGINGDLEQGWRWIKAKAFTKAHAIFQKIHGEIEHVKNPKVDVASLKMGLAICEQKRGEFNTAISILKDVKRGFPHRHRVDMVMARCYQESGDYGKAIKIFQEVRKKKPRDKIILNGLARCYEEAERFDEAVKEFETLIGMDPQNPEWKISLAFCLRGMGRYDKAISMFSKIAEECPYDRKISFGLIGCYNSIGDFDAVVKLYQSLLSGCPNPSERSMELALCYQKMGKFNEGIKLLRQFPPNHLEVRLAVSRLYLKKRDFMTSLEILLTLNRAYHKDKNVLLALAKCYAARYDVDNTLKVFDSLNDSFPDDKEVLLAEARYHAKHDETEKTEMLYQKLLKLFPKDKEVYLKVAEFKLQSGKTREALTMFSRLTQRFPYFLEAWIGYLTSMGDLSGPEAAIGIYKKHMARRFPYHPKMFDTVAKRYAEAKRYDEAIDLLLKIRERSPYFSNAYDGLSICYEMTGQHNQRQRILMEGIRILPYNLRLNCELVRLLLEEERVEEAEEHRSLCLRTFANDAFIKDTLDEVLEAHREENTPSYLKVPDLTDSLEGVRDYFENIFLYGEALHNYRRIKMNGTLEKIFPDLPSTLANSWIEKKMEEVDSKFGHGDEVPVDYLLAIFFTVLTFDQSTPTSFGGQFTACMRRVLKAYAEKGLIDNSQVVSQSFRVLLFVKELRSQIPQNEPVSNAQLFKVISHARSQAKELKRTLSQGDLDNSWFMEIDRLNPRLADHSLDTFKE